MREFGPITTTPGTAGAAAAAVASCALRAAASFSPATRMTRRPPDEGTMKVSDTSASPLTVASARTSAPAGRFGNSARPWSSVVAFRAAPFTVRRTACSATLLPIASRTTRTVTVPIGSSAAGMARPWISAGSGMAICAKETANPNAQIPTPNTTRLTTPPPALTRNSYRTSRRDRSRSDTARTFAN